MSITKSYPCLIICGTRTGGTYLSHALDAHPDIFSARQEILDGQHITSRLTKGLGPRDRLRLYLEVDGYLVTVAKVVYGQARGEDHVLGWLDKSAGKSILLTRNYIHSVISILARKADKHHKLKGHYPPHTTRPLELFQFTVNPAALLNGARQRKKMDNVYRTKLKGLGIPILEIDYQDIANEGGVIPLDTTKRLCDFLGVGVEPLRARLRKGIRWSYDRVIVNWPEVYSAVKESEFAKCLP